MIPVHAPPQIPPGRQSSVLALVAGHERAHSRTGAIDDVFDRLGCPVASKDSDFWHRFLMQMLGAQMAYGVMQRNGPPPAMAFTGRGESTRVEFARIAPSRRPQEIPSGAPIGPASLRTRVGGFQGLICTGSTGRVGTHKPGRRTLDLGLARAFT